VHPIETHGYGGPRRKSDLDGAVLKLRKLRLDGNTPQAWPSLYTALSVELQRILQDCSWPRIPKMLTALDEEQDRVKGIYPGAFISVGLDDLARQTPPRCKLTREALTQDGSASHRGSSSLAPAKEIHSARCQRARSVLLSA
jgi:hypothetical protein